MLGYLRPTFKKSNSKLKKQYRALYCGLCHRLKKEYGYRGVTCLNYEVVFLLLLIISVNENGCEIFHGSCSLTPFVRVPFIDYLNNNAKVASDISIMVSIFEIKDNVTDEGIFIWKLFDKLLKGIYKKAVKELSDFEKQIHIKLITFNNIEKSNNCCLDDLLKACGDIVESILYPLLSGVDGPIAEMVSKIANSIGQWIYLVDACDDFQKDIVTNSFNPLLNVDNHQVIYDKIRTLQEYISRSISELPLNEYGELLKHFSDNCIPQSSNKILEKYEASLESVGR